MTVVGCQMFSLFARQQTTRQTRARLLFVKLLGLALLASPLYGAALRFDEGFAASFTHTQAGFEYVTDIKEQRDGKIVVGGWFDFANGVARGRIARVNADGCVWGCVWGSEGALTASDSGGYVDLQQRQASGDR